jgi:uncharacterized membrane protein HdeD (DUF308 family)
MEKIDEVKAIGKKMVYIAIIAGLINFIPGIAISRTTTHPYFNWVLLGLAAIIVSLLAYWSMSSKKDLSDAGGLMVSSGWLLVAIGFAIVCSAFSEFYFVSWSAGIFNLIAAILLIVPMFYFMSVIIKEAQVSIVP